MRRRSRRTPVTIVCFLLLGSLEAPDVQSASPERDAALLAREVLERAGFHRGLCAILGMDADLSLELARQSELLVHVRGPGAQAAAALRKKANEAGFGLRRLTVEQGTLDKLPYADNTIDVIVATRTKERDPPTPRSEILRVLRPEGVAILQTREGTGWKWTEIRKPELEGADEWSHWEKGPDNNPVSTDQVIKAPYMTQFLAKPYYIGMPSVTTAAGGRTFLAIGHIAHHQREWSTLYKLIGRNGYNGAVLWERPLPEGYLVHRSAFIATKDTFFMIDGATCLLLDPQTGKEKGRIRIPGVETDWKWMALKDGILHVLAGEAGPGAERIPGDRAFGGWSWADLSRGYYGRRIPFGFADTLAAYDTAKQTRLWIHKEEALIDSRSLAVDDDYLYLYCPDRHLRALNAKDGKVVWTNRDKEVLDLIEKPGQGLTSTPGFRTQCLTVATPQALIIQGQTRMNVVAVSTRNGYLLWTKKKVTNNPNAIYVDGNVVLGVGPGGSHVVIDPLSGQVQEDLKFRKVSCTRLTAAPDSFFCRGEGTLRFDRGSKKVLVDGGVRPACNDGALPANGMLYVGPWQCDCNLSLIGCLGKCSAGDFRFDHVATEAGRLQEVEGRTEVAEFPVSDNDWPTYRGNNRRTAGTKALAARAVVQRWVYNPPGEYVPMAPTVAGSLVFVSGEDGKVRALDSGNGTLRWEFASPAPIKASPTIWEGRVYIGCGDGHLYVLEAVSGRLLWRFRAAPVERHIMVYGYLCSTWPVNSGVLVQDGVAYFAAGIVDHDGTYVYALDARTGKIKWQNSSSGHLSKELRKGVSVQGNLTTRGNLLLLASGNQVSPTPFNLETGDCLAQPFNHGHPKANAGQFVGVFNDDSLIFGGRILYSAPENVATKGGFDFVTSRRTLKLCFGGIPPAWNESIVALVNFKHGKLTTCDAGKVAERVQKGFPEPEGRGRRRWFTTIADVLPKDNAVRWQSDLGESSKFEVVSLAVCPNAVVAVAKHQERFRAQPQWFLAAFDAKNGARLYRHELHQEPLPGGLLVDAQGQVVLTALNGNVLCFGPRG